MLRNIVLFMLLLHVNLLLAQTYEDSVQLEEIRIYGIPLKEFSTGSKIYQIDSAAIAQSAQNSLAELLSRRSPLYFKDYGQGMLSTISFRGTSSNHTAVLWNGLNINLPTLGQSDFSLLPVFAFQQVDIQPGSGSTLYGSGAIGGSIHLYHEPDWEDRFEISLNQGIGSYSNYFTGLSTQYSKNNFESLTKLYFQSQENDFPFIKSNGEKQRQQNAAIKRYGLVQELNYRLASNRYLSFSGWYNYMDRQIQPTRNNNFNKGQYTEQVDNSLRLSADYHHNSSLGYFNAKLAYIRDYLHYNHVNEYLTEQYVASLRYDKKLGERTDFTIGVQSNHTRADVEQYEDFESEDRVDIYAAFKFQITPWWKGSISGRQSFAPGHRVPFVPSLGSEIKLLSDQQQDLLLRVLAGKSFRLPTLNERFWVSGNPAIKPEKGYNVESGLDYNLKRAAWEGKTSLTYYAMWIDDWILWQPGIPEWYPENVKEVTFSGIEWTADITTTPYPNGKITTGLSYAYSRAINQTALSEYSRAVGKQLPYSPRHSGVLYADFLWKQWQAAVGWTATGKRYIGDDNVDYLQPYALLNIGLNRQINLKDKTNLLIAFKVNNLLNTQFETYQNRAMPGINYEANIKLNFYTKP